MLEDGNESPRLEEAFRDRMIHMGSTAIEPWSVSVDAAFPSTVGIQALFTHFIFACLGLFPLAPEDASQAATYPFIQFLSKPFCFAQTEVLRPAAMDWVERFFNKPLQVLTFSFGTAKGVKRTTLRF